jgi:hypothetical protein
MQPGQNIIYDSSDSNEHRRPKRDKKILIKLPQ